jgi:hypothetical protein
VDNPLRGQNEEIEREEEGGAFSLRESFPQSAEEAGWKTRKAANKRLPILPSLAV